MIVLPADEAARSISRRLRLSVVAGLAFMLWVMPATRACRELIENRTQIARFRLSENRLPDAFRYSALNIIMMIGMPTIMMITSSMMTINCRRSSVRVG